jgi:hypothetical protein
MRRCTGAWLLNFLQNGVFDYLNFKLTHHYFAVRIGESTDFE